MYVSPGMKKEATILRKLDVKKKQAFHCMVNAKTRKQRSRCAAEHRRLYELSQRRWKKLLKRMGPR